MKKILKIIFITTAILIVSACTKKDRISAEDFKIKMNEKGYAIATDTEMLKNENIKNMYIALEGESGLQIEFYEFNNKDSAKEFYEHNKEIFDLNTTNAQNIKGINYEKYSKEADNTYKTVIRVEDTVIYSDAKEEEKDKVKDTIDYLGY